MRPAPLHGIRVLDLTRLLPGPMASLHLADMGADVIKVEDTGAGDYARSMGPGEPGLSDFFRLINRNKRAIRLDLKQAEGREAFLRLVETADALLESFRPGVMAKLGLGYETLAARNPRLVYVSLSGYGQDGPYAQRAGHDINYLGYAGVADQIGTGSGPPVLPNFQIADLLGGTLSAVMGLLAALVDARGSGRGRRVDVAMTDAVLAHAIFPLLGLLEQGEAPARGTGLLSGGLACYGFYATRDGRAMAVGALERKFWDVLCDILRCPELKPEHLARGEAAAAAKARLAAIFATRTQAEWTALFAAADCCVSPVLTIAEALDNEQLRARGMVREENGALQLALPLQFSEFDFALRRAAPRPGEHTDQVLQAAGFSEAELAALRAKGVL